MQIVLDGTRTQGIERSSLILEEIGPDEICIAVRGERTIVSRADLIKALQTINIIDTDGK